MINWHEVSEAGFRFEVPERLKRVGALPLFKGKVIKGQLDTEVWVVFHADISLSKVSEMRDAYKKEPFTGSGEFKCVYNLWGPSKVREGGLEVGTTDTATNPRGRGRGHRWGIIFPVRGKWVELDIANGYGGFEWEEFEAIGKRIIQSVTAI